MNKIILLVGILALFLFVVIGCNSPGKSTESFYPRQPIQAPDFSSWNVVETVEFEGSPGLRIKVLDDPNTEVTPDGALYQETTRLGDVADIETLHWWPNGMSGNWHFFVHYKSSDLGWFEVQDFAWHVSAVKGMLKGTAAVYFSVSYTPFIKKS